MKQGMIVVGLAAFALAASAVFWMKGGAEPEGPAVDASTIQGSAFEIAKPAEVRPGGATIAAETAKPEPPREYKILKLPPPPKPVEAPKPAAASSKSAATPAGASATSAGGPIPLSFKTLSSFRYLPQAKPEPGKTPDPTSIPAGIRDLHGKKVTIDGYMVPVDFEKGKVLTFILSQAMFGCCFGDSPQITELIKVVPVDKKPMTFTQMARVTGTLEVGEIYDADGYIEAIYQIRSDQVGSSMDK